MKFLLDENFPRSAADLIEESGGKSERLYKIYGKEKLSDADWVYPTNTLHRFFKVTVEMP